LKISELKENKGTICEKILRSLPDWFGIETAILDYISDAEQMLTLVAENEAQEKVGFLTLNFHNQFSCEVHVMGVLPDFHGRGIGSALINEAEALLVRKGTRFLTVKTLSPSRESSDYQKTRMFYESKGFLPLEEFKTLWGEDNPCLMMIRVL
jgi:GNAT superfamily N-acetyltransferase